MSIVFLAKAGRLWYNGLSCKRIIPGRCPRHPLFGRKPMKILHLISGGDTGGAKTHVHTLLAGLTPLIQV